MLPDVFERYRAPLEDELHRKLADQTLPIYHMMRYHLGWVEADGRPASSSVGGKAFRPVLCLLGCEAVGGDWRKALPAAAALELIHNFSLIHDDIQDVDVERRHRPTVWYLWGPSTAITVGDAIRILAKLALRRLSTNGIGPEKALNVWAALEANSLAMIEGQYLDLAFEGRSNVSVEDYLRMISLKTGALISTSLKIGCTLGTDDPKVIGSLEDFGAKIGLVFQVTDDILGAWGESETTGKPTASDIARKKKSLPVVYATQAGPDKVRKRIFEIYRKPALDEADTQTVLGLLDEAGARAYCEGVAHQYAEAAIASLAHLNLGPWATNQLEGLCRFLLDRKF